MLIQDRVSKLREGFRDAGAAIDAARVLANITGEPQTVYLDLEHKTWYVRSIGGWTFDGGPKSHWDHAGGVYLPGETRSGMQTNRDITPENYEARGCGVHVDTMIGMWRKEWERSCSM